MTEPTIQRMQIFQVRPGDQVYRHDGSDEPVTIGRVADADTGMVCLFDTTGLLIRQERETVMLDVIR